MSKIICDVCGTSYPDTATQCPICGCVRSGEAQSVSGDTSEAGSGAYTYVKGGRFSKANVRKRNKANAVVSVNTVSDEPLTDEPEEKKSNAGLVAAAVILLLAIIAVVIYIALRFFMPGALSGDQDKSTGATGDTTASVQTTDATVPCEGITLDVETITLNEEGSARMLYATTQPDNVTDEIVYTSDNEAVATVTQGGKVTAVGPGQATITVTCGQFSAQCVVECTFQDPTQDTTEATTDETTEATTATDDGFKLNRMDITFSYKGESWVIYSGSVGLTAITWSSDDENVAKIENGKVTAVGSGMTTVYAEYEGQKASCIIRCSFSDASESTGISGNGGGVSEDGGGISEDGSLSSSPTGSLFFYSQYGIIDKSDTTIGVNETLRVSLKDSSGNDVGVAFSLNGSSCTLDGNLVTGISRGDSTISALYNGVTYTCTIRVSVG